MKKWPQKVAILATFAFGNQIVRFEKMPFLTFLPIEIPNLKMAPKMGQNLENSSLPGIFPDCLPSFKDDDKIIF